MPRKRWIGLGAAITAIAIAGAAAWSLRDDYAAARIATAYVAKQTCSCTHVSGRPLDACLADFSADPARHQVTVTQDATQTRASLVFGAIHAEAHYEDGFGCRLLD